MVEQEPRPVAIGVPVAMDTSVVVTVYSRWPLPRSAISTLASGASLKAMQRSSAPFLRRVGLSPHPGITPKCVPFFMIWRLISVTMLARALSSFSPSMKSVFSWISATAVLLFCCSIFVSPLIVDKLF